MSEAQKYPEWKFMLESFGERPYDSLITYDELNTAAHGDVREEKSYVLHKFRKEMLRQKLRALENIQNQGYRIVQANEHTRLSRREIDRAYRRAKSGAEIILNVDMEQLTDKERAEAVLMATRVQNMASTLLGERKAVKNLTVNFKLPEIPRSQGPVRQD